MDLLNDYGFSDDNGYAVETVTYVVDMHALASQQFTEKQATSFVETAAKVAGHSGTKMTQGYSHEPDAQQFRDAS